MSKKERYTDAIEHELAKGRTFESILLEEPDLQCDSIELYAWLDTWEWCEQRKVNNNLVVIHRKVKALEIVLLCIISAQFISFFTIEETRLLWFNLPLGIAVARLGRLNDSWYARIRTQVEMNYVNRCLLEDGFLEKEKIRLFFVRLLFTPHQLFCRLCEVVFPPVNFCHFFERTSNACKGD
jgi:hypothetical protein